MIKQYKDKDMTNFFLLTDVLSALFISHPLRVPSFSHASVPLIPLTSGPTPPLSPTHCQAHCPAPAGTAGHHRCCCLSSWLPQLLHPPLLPSMLWFECFKRWGPKPFLFCRPLDSKMVESVLFWCENYYFVVWLKCGYWMQSLNCVWGLWDCNENWRIVVYVNEIGDVWGAAKAKGKMEVEETKGGRTQIWFFCISPRRTQSRI